MAGKSSKSESNQANGNPTGRGIAGADRSAESSGSINNSSKFQSTEKSFKRVEVQIFGQKYNIISEEEPERVKKLAQQVNTKMNEIASDSKGLSALKIAVLTALNISEEMLTFQENTEGIARKGEKLISLLSGVIEN